MKMKRILAVVLMAVMLIGVIPVGAQAADWGEGDTLDDALSELKVGFRSAYLDWLVLPNLGVINFRYSYFQYDNERTGTVDEHPVYCIDPTKGGAYEFVQNVGPNTDGSDTATYIRGEKVGDAKYKSIMAAGFPQMRYTSLGLQSEEEGYYATKLALWMYIRGNNPDKLTINPKYGNDDPVALRVRDAAVAIYNNGTKSSAAREPKLTLTGKPSATATLDTSGEYYVQGVEVYASGWIGTSTEACGDVQLSWESLPPAGTIVLGSDGEDITSALAVKMSANNGWIGKVTIKYPASEVDESFSPPTLKAKAIVPNDAIYVAYAKVDKDKYQRYLVASDPKIELAASFVSQLNIPTDRDFPSESGLRIRKLQTGTLIPLEGAVFEIRDPDGKLICSMATDASGIIDIPLYVTGNYTVTEVTPPEYHLLSAIRTQSVTVKYGEVAEVTFTNAPYGTLRVVKRDAANGSPLGGAAVQIRHITTNTIQEMHTDSSGSAVFEKLPVGAYEIVEITAPDGYALDNTPHTVNVLPLSRGETSYTLTNKALPGLRITKFDRQTMMPIEGVTFEIWHDGELFGTRTTDAWGEIELRNIPAGTYTVKEVATVAPYVLDTTAQWIEIKAGQGYISDLIFFNLAKPGINLIKIDSVTFEPLVNAKFLIKNVGGTFAKEYTTNENGEINLSMLDPGAYIVEEITAPDGYLIDDAIRTIQINVGENAQFVFTNTKRPVLEVLKFDGENYLPGATFRIALIADGSHYIDRITDENGRIHIAGLEPGIYSVKELQPPPGYLPNDTEYHVELFPGRTSQLVVNNVRKPDLLIVKTDANTGLPIEGVTYTVKKADSSTLETVSTDLRGEAWMYALDEGVYQITEQSVPPTHLLDETPQLITLVGGHTGVVRFQNFPRPKLKILKVDVVTGERLPNAEFRVSKAPGSTVSEYITDASGEILVENLDVAIYEAEEFMPPDGYILFDESKQIQLEPGKTSVLKFDNIRKPTLIVTKLNGLTNQSVPGATYKIEYEAAGGGLVLLGSYLTDASGQIIIPKVNAGWYVVTETKAAPGFSLPSNPVTRIYLSPGENAYLSEGIGTGTEQGSSDFTVLSGNDFTPTIGTSGELVYNWPLNSIVIKKTHAITGELLAGAAFELYRADSQVSGVPGTNVGRFTTDNSGVIVITGLEPGYYVVKEVQAPQNFLISENSMQNGFLKADGTTVLEFTFSNYPYGSILITKVDAQTNKPLANARFRVTDSSGAVLGNSSGEFITDENGEIIIPNVKPGAYIVTEIEAPQYYAVDTTPQTVNVGTDGKTYKVSFKNQPAGEIVIRKLDFTSKEPLAGAEFRVTDSTGAVVGTGNGIFCTDATGTVKIPNLPKGSYVLEEIAAPAGYVLENQTQTIAVDYGKTYTIDFYNKKMSGLQIIKLDSVTRQPIAGAEFAVAHMNGERVGTYKTDKSGIITLSELTPGWYTISEVKAATGYILDAAPQNVEITTGKSVTLEITNTPMSGLLIIKTDEQTRKPLAGVKFEVKKAKGEQVGIYTTDQSGRIYVTDIPAGKYVVVETAALDGYVLDSTAHEVTVYDGKQAILEVKNTQLAGLRLVKIDSITKKPIYNVEFMLFDANNKVVGTFYTDNNGVIDFSGIITEGRYTIRETRAAAGYYLDEIPKTVEFVSGKVTEIVWTNVPKMAQIQILKLSGDDNEVNGLPAGTPLAGAVFEAYDYKTGNLVDRFVSGSDGRAVSVPLPLGRYLVKEVKSPQWYKLSDKMLDIELEFATQIVKLEYLNYAANTGVTIRKTGPAECMPGDTISYTIKEIRNTGTTPLTDFYWRDTLPVDAVRLTKIVTGNYNQALKYKVMITTNKGDTRVIADNLSTTKNNVIDCSNASLGLKNDEYVTSFTLVFGTVKAGFTCVEQPQIFVKTLSTLQNGYQFANKADVGGKYGSEWVVGNSTTLCTVYKKSVPLPRTGY